MLRLFFSALLIAAALLAAPGARAQTPEPPQVRELLDLLSDPAVRAWLDGRRGVPGSPPVVADDGPMMSASMAEGWVAQVRGQLAAVVASLPVVPGEVARVGGLLWAEIRAFGVFSTLLLMSLFIGSGVAARGLYWVLSDGPRRRLIARPLDTVRDRLVVMGIRLAYMAIATTVTILGSIGPFLLFEWPPILRAFVLGCLIVFIAVRTAEILCRFVIAPGGPRFRILPMTTEAAWYWTWRITVFVGYVGTTSVLLDLFVRLGMMPDALFAARRVVGFGGLLLLLEAIWRMPAGSVEGARRLGRAWALTGLLLVFYLLRASAQGPLAWTLFVVVALPFAIGLVHRAVGHILRPPGTEADPDPRPSVTVAVVEGGLRLVLVVGAAALLARVWEFDVQSMAMAERPSTRIVRGAVNAAVILLVADWVWRVARAVIDRSLAEAQGGTTTEGEAARRRARIRTLLPILRNIMFVALAVMAVMMALSALGIEIAPLIAGAGVIGVAIGFGAQTLVKDVISGLFFLFDDAFRVGEYIQSGSYKGTVESFSLRSIKLRHHRGPLYTVPFGELGAIQNMSRDWVIDKMTIGVTYDTDLEKARKLVKDVGKKLAADPEMGPKIMETLKMQGVEAFGDFAIQIRLKIMTRPGEQFVIRRKAMAMVRQAFQENGIEFAFPKVLVDGGGSVAAAAASTALPVDPTPGPA